MKYVTQDRIVFSLYDIFYIIMKMKDIYGFFEILEEQGPI